MSANLRNTDIVIFTLSRSDSPISSPSLALAKEFSKTQRVFYVNHPFSLKDILSQPFHKDIQKRWATLAFGTHPYTEMAHNLVAVDTRFSWPINSLDQGQLYNHFQRWNDKVLFSALRKLIRDYNIKDFVYINAFDPFFGIKFPDDIKPKLKVYQSMDDMSQVAYTAKHGVRLEGEIIQNFDFALTTSRRLKKLKEVHSPEVHLHPNAADIDLFRKAAEDTPLSAPELDGISGPIVGFIGHLDHDRIDYPLLSKVIDKNPDKTIVIIGPVSSPIPLAEGWNKKPNVKMIDSKKIEELPAYLQKMDCCLIPFDLNVLTQSIYPLKVNEYLAAGKPVIATRFSDDIASFKEVIYLASTHDEYLELINRSIEENTLEKQAQRIEVAETNTWAARVAQFWTIAEKYN